MRRVLCALGLGSILSLVLPMVAVLGQTSDPVVGTWELNVAKSTFSPGPAPKSETRTYVQAGADIKATSKGVDGEGKPTSEQWIVLFLKRIDAYTTEFTEKRAGKLVLTGTRVISRDGKVMTITSKGTNAKGQAVNDVMVFDKK